MFSGGDYHEVERWLRNFLTSHAKREHPRIEVTLDADGDREGRSYAATLTLGARSTPPVEFDFREVAENRGNLAWCRALADRTRALARWKLLDKGEADARRG
jgi:hypothetical protein